MLAVFGARDQFAFGGSIAAQLISDGNARLTILYYLTNLRMKRLAVLAFRRDWTRISRTSPLASTLARANVSGPSVTAVLGEYLSGCAKL